MAVGPQRPSAGPPPEEEGERVQTEIRRAPTAQNYSHPMSAEIADWLALLQRTARALRTYDRNNAVIHQFLDRAVAGMEHIHAQIPELVLTVREDRLRFDRDPVLINADRSEGLPFILYRNAFRRITFVQGMTRPELLELLSAVMTDFSTYDAAGEDLLTTLWRLQLPHLRYFTIDALSVSVSSTGEKARIEREDVDRLQGDIDGLVARIYNQKEVDDADLVKGVSITQDDLEALKAIRAEGAADDFDTLDVATQRVIAEIPPAELERLLGSLYAEDHDSLIERLIDILFHLLFKEDTSEGALKTVELIQQLFDSLLLANRLAHMTRLVQRLHDTEATAEDLKEVHVARHLLRLISAESRVSHVVALFNDAKQAVPAHDIIEFLKAVGPAAAGNLLNLLDALTSAGHRRLILDLIVDMGVLEGPALHERMQRSQWFVTIELLNLAQKLPRADLAPILLWAVDHEHPKVRALAVGMLRIFPSGVADELIAKAIGDADAEVRISALRLVAGRKSTAARNPIESVLKGDDFWDLDPRELRAMMLAYAIVFRDQSVPLLERALNPGFFARSKMTNAQMAAAMALGRIATPTAREALARGQRTLNTKVRDAIKTALAREPDAETSAMLNESEAPPATGDLTKDRPADMSLSDELRAEVDPLEVARSKGRRGEESKNQLIPAAKTPGRASVETFSSVRKAYNEPDKIPERINRLAVEPPPRGAQPPPKLDTPIRGEPVHPAPQPGSAPGGPARPPPPRPSWTHSGAAVSVESLPGTRAFPSEAATVVERPPVPSAPPGLVDDLTLGSNSWATPSPFGATPAPQLGSPPQQPPQIPGAPTPPWGQGMVPPPTPGHWAQGPPPSASAPEWSWGSPTPHAAPPRPPPQSSPQPPGWAPPPAWSPYPQAPPQPFPGQSPPLPGQPQPWQEHSASLGWAPGPHTPMPPWGEASHSPAWQQQGTPAPAWQQPGTPAPAWPPPGTPLPSWVESNQAPQSGTPAPWIEPSSAPAWPPAQAQTPTSGQTPLPAWTDPYANQSARPAPPPSGWGPPAQSPPSQHPPSWAQAPQPAPSWSQTQPMQLPPQWPQSNYHPNVPPPQAPIPAMPTGELPAWGQPGPGSSPQWAPQFPPAPPQPGWPPQQQPPQPAWPQRPAGPPPQAWSQQSVLPPDPRGEQRPPEWPQRLPEHGWGPTPRPPDQMWTQPGAPVPRAPEPLQPPPSPRAPGAPSWSQGASPRPAPPSPPPAAQTSELPSWANANSGQWPAQPAVPRPPPPPQPNLQSAPGRPAPPSPPPWPGPPPASAGPPLGTPAHYAPTRIEKPPLPPAEAAPPPGEVLNAGVYRVSPAKEELPAVPTCRGTPTRPPASDDDPNRGGKGG